MQKRQQTKAWRQVRGWMDYYGLDEDTFATLVATTGGCSREAVYGAIDGINRPPFVVAQAIQTVTAVDAYDWYVCEHEDVRAVTSSGTIVAISTGAAVATPANDTLVA